MRLAGGEPLSVAALTAQIVEYGHQTGDQILHHVGLRTARHFSPGNTQLQRLALRDSLGFLQNSRRIPH